MSSKFLAANLYSTYLSDIFPFHTKIVLAIIHNKILDIQKRLTVCLNLALISRNN